MRRLPHLIAFAALAAGCASAGARPVEPPRPEPAPPGPAAAPALPPIPLVDGPLRPRVQYPSANAVIAARDSNFIFGSVGTGRATLTINGAPVAVLPNGAYLTYLPLPPRDAPRYELV